MTCPSHSLTAAVNRMLEEVVQAAVGPSPKRKEPEASPPERLPSSEGSNEATETVAEVRCRLTRRLHCRPLRADQL